MFVSQYYKDISTVSVNNELPRTTFVSHDDRDEAIKNVTQLEKSPYYINLNGQWEFYFNEYPKKVPNDIATNVNQNTVEWKEITVPGNWERQGFGTAIYTDEIYDFCPVNPRPPYLPDLNPVGIYRRKNIEIPKSWIDQERDIFIQIGAAKSALYLYVNGKEIGYHEDSKDPADFLINEYIHQGNDNVVTLVIFKYCTGSYLEDQDMWRLGGIERDVYIYSQPKTHIRDFKVVSTLDNEYKTGIFKLKMNIINHNKTENIDVVAGFEVIDMKNNVVLHNQLDSTINSNTENILSFGESSLENVEKWSAENPYLYILLLTLKNKSDNSILEIVSFRIGFRREEMYSINFNKQIQTILLFNGMPVIFKGVNIHEHDEKTGHYVTDEVRLKDIKLLKQHNFNALRFSHYPNCRRLYELCDEYGFYVYNECNIESHGMGFDPKRTLANRSIWHDAHMDRTKNMYERTKNYACVTFFSLGNEAGNGRNFLKTYQYLKEQETDDQNRPINYECIRWLNNTDMFVPQYPKTNDLLDMSECIIDKPIVPSEYQHAMGNANGNFNSMWKKIYEIPNLQGGFIWDWVDQGLLEINKEGRKFWTYGGDYGLNVPSDGNFNINGVVNPDRTPHPAMAEFKYSQQNIGFELIDLEKGIIKIYNRFFFADLHDYDIICSIKSNERIVKIINLSESFKEIQFLKPQETFEINLSNEIDQLIPQINTEYFLNFSVLAKTDNQPFIPKGFEIAHDQFRLQIEPLPKGIKHETGPDLFIDSSSQNNIIISSSKVIFIFNKVEGVVKSYKVDGREFISNSFGFQPNFWRAPTDNDYGNGGPFREGIWRENSGNFNVEQCEAMIENNVAKLTVVYLLTMKSKYQVIYTILASGIVKVKINYKHANNESIKYCPNIPRLGFRFHVPQEMHNIIYFGRGPEENYLDRCSGTRIDLFKTTAEDLYFPYVRPQENGHHIDTRWLAAYDDSTSSHSGILINADGLIQFNALRNFVEDFEDVNFSHLPTHFKKNKLGNQKKIIANKSDHQHHIDDVFPRDFVEINIDLKQQGLAGFNSWEDRILPEFTIPANQNYSYSFTIVPFKDESEISQIINYDYE